MLMFALLLKDKSAAKKYESDVSCFIFFLCLLWQFSEVEMSVLRCLDGRERQR